MLTSLPAIRDENETCPQTSAKDTISFKQIYEHDVEEQVVIMEWTIILKT